MIDISFRKVSINDIDESQRSDLDRLMDSDRTSTVFNDVGLALIYQKHFPRSRMYTYQIFYKSDMIGYFVSNEVFKCGLKYVYSPPVNSLFPYGGVVVHSDFAKESQFICNKLLTSIMRPNCSLYIASNPDQCCFDSSAGSTSLMNIPTLFIDVSLGRDEIWRLMENRTRRNIKKALKNSVTVKKKSLEDFSSVADHLRIYRQLCERKGLTYVSDDYYYDIMRYVSDKYHLDVYYGVCNEITVSSMTACFYKQMVFPWFGGTDIDYQNTEAGSLVYWEIMHNAADAGLQTFDFLGLGVGPVAFYKKGFGGYEAPVRYHQKKSLIHEFASMAKRSIRR